MSTDVPSTTRPDDLDPLEVHLLDGIGAVPLPASGPVPASEWSRQRPVRPGTGLTLELARDLFRAQVHSRHLDHTARWLRARGAGFYTIGSAGHESNAAVALAVRSNDPALLHYRSGGFYLARAGQERREPLPGVRDVLAGLLGLAEEPIAGGRHKVFGHPSLDIIPQTSTIASHLPRAVGIAFAIERAARLEVATRWADDAVVVCSFGDASVNHSTAQGALNTAGYIAHSGLGVPLLFVCEDNGLGISVPSPTGWVASTLSGRPGVGYAAVDGDDPAAVFDTTRALVDEIRATRRPAVLHVRTVRFLAHAGSDVESAYRTPAAMRADLAHDPVLATARLLIDAGVVTPGELEAYYLTTRAAVRELATSMVGLPTLSSADEIMAPLAPHRPYLVESAAWRAAKPERRLEVFGDSLPEDEGPLTLAETINRSLADQLAARPEVLVFGEDVGVKGGVYGVTRGLARRAGAARVFDSLLDEQSILGVALGAAVSGLLPIPEIQYLAYLHNAEDQLRGEAASLSFFSQGAYRNGLVVRIAGLAYQKGFGGHFHNDNAVAVLRDIPGLVVACPGHPVDAAAMLRTCVAAAEVDGTVSVFLEPIALYHTRDLHEPGDGLWTAAYRGPQHWAADDVPIGRARLARPGEDLLVVTWGNGLHLSLRAAERLADLGVSVRVLDLRWLAPLPLDDVLAHAAAVGRVLVVDETRHSGGVGEAVLAGLVERDYAGLCARIAARDSFVPLGDAANLVLVSDDDVVDAALDLMRR